MKLLIAATLFSSIAMAHESDQNCSLELHDDLLVQRADVQLLRSDNPLWRISDQGQLWINNQSVDTDASTAVLLQQYQAGLRDNAEQTVTLVADAVSMASEALTRVMAQFEVDNGEAQANIDRALNKMRTNLDQILLRSDNSIRINGSKLAGIDNGFDDEMSKAIEESVAEITGNALMLVGKAMSSGEGNFEQRMEAFGQKMEKFGDELEADMNVRGEQLEARGQQICSSLQQLDGLEAQIQAKVPAMQQFDLIQVSTKEDRADTDKTNSAE
ncbi:DUF2884 family protein [Rheinheimera sp. F8]|uniref:DUF2884 family protein n=1 Tax=Rheinheimera sp. F8 TaxID=1763998 RepID=UPI000744B313|nr:DUF2884 family protein [Rheinheimera sp. F8]ALZ74838.1 hypothetical protein ATY27_03085 [Rheinheimera sp. F8]